MTLILRQNLNRALTWEEMDDNLQLLYSGSLSGSLTLPISGSLIPVVLGSATSSFSLGSPTAAWKDLWVSDGTINFLDSTGAII